MATAQPTQEYGELQAARERASKFAVSGSMGEVVCGIAALVLAIIGLANSDWMLLASVATVVTGAALAFAGASAAVQRASVGATNDEFELGSVSAEFLGGAAAIVLGTLALLGIVPNTLISVAVIVAGASLIVGSLATRRAFLMASLGTNRSPACHIAHESAGAQSLVGLAAVVLGIIALVGNADYAATLELVGLLVIGAGVLVTGGAVSTRLFLSLTRHHGNVAS